MNQLKTLDRLVKKQKTGHVVVTSTVEVVMSEEYVNEQLELLAIHQQRAQESLEKINMQIQEFTEIKKKFI